MALNLMGLGFVFEAQDHASHTIHMLEEKIGHLEEETGIKTAGMEEHFATMALGLGAVLASMEGFEKILELAEHAADAQQNLLSLKATTGATADELERMEAAAVKFTEHSQFDDDVALNTLKKLRQQAFDTTSAIELLKPALDLAELSENRLTPEGAAQGLARVMKEYKVDVADASLVVDQMAHAVSRWGFEVSSLPTALSRAQAGAEKINASLTDVMMVTALVKDGFRNQTQAANAVAAAMAKIADPKVAAQFGHLREKMSLRDANGEFKNFLDIIVELDPILKKMGPDKERDWLTKTFGANSTLEKTLVKVRSGIRGVNGEMITGAAAVKKLSDGFLDAEETAEHMIHILHSGFHGAMAQVDKMKKDLKEEIGMGFLVALTPLIRLAAEALHGLVEVLRAIPLPIRTMVAVLSLVTLGLIGVIGGLTLARGGWWLLGDSIKLSIAQLRTFIVTMWEALVPMLPWIIAAGIIAGLIYVFIIRGVTLKEVWDKVGDTVKAFGLILAVALPFLLVWMALTGGFAVALGWLETALIAANAQLWIMDALMTANPFGAIIVGILLLFGLITLVAIKLNGSWKGFIQAFKIGVEEMGQFFDKYVIGPLKWIWEALTKIWVFFGGNKPKVEAPKDKDTLETDIDKLVRTERGIGGKVSGRGIQMDDAEEGLGEGPRLATPEMIAKLLAHGGGPKVKPKVPGGVEAISSEMPEIPQLSEADMAALIGGQHQTEAPTVSIDYDKLAEAMSKRPIRLEMDGEAVGAALAKIQRGNFSRASVMTSPE